MSIIEVRLSQCGGCRTTFGFFVRPTPAPGTIIDHSIGAKVLVAVQGPWRLSARADRKTLTDAYLDYTHTIILVTDGEVVRGPRPLKAVSEFSMKNLSKVIALESPAREGG